MHRSLIAALAAILLLAGCSAPTQEVPGSDPAPSPVQRPQPLPPQTRVPGAPQIESTEDGLLVKGVQESHQWFADGRRLAVLSDTGLWSVQPEGGMVDLLAPAGPSRRLVGSHNDYVVYLEQQPDTLLAFIARPGQEPQQVALLAHEGVGQAGYPFWANLNGSRLSVAIEGRRPAAIDLATGRIDEMGDEAIPVWKGGLALSPNRRYLAYKQANRGDEVRVLDLKSGTVFRPGDESHVGVIAWSPDSTRWAVRAAKPNSNLPTAVGANLEEGGDHIDIGTTQGGFHHLEPPLPLELVAGPWWSADGNYLAVTSGDAGGTAPRQLWVIDLATGEWRWVGTVPRSGFVVGFHPTERLVMVQSDRGLYRWPITDQPEERLEIPWLLESGSPVVLNSRSLLYLSAEAEPRLYLERPGGKPTLVLERPERMERLRREEERLTLLLYGDGPLHDLLILPKP